MRSSPSSTPPVPPAGVPAARRATGPPAAAGHRAVRRPDQHRLPDGDGLPRRVGLPRTSRTGRRAADRTCTAMTEPPIGVCRSETLRGEVRPRGLTLGSRSSCRSTRGRPEPARVVGHVTTRRGAGGCLGGRPGGGDGPALDYRARVRLEGRWVDLEAGRELADDAGLDAWADMTTVEFRRARASRARCGSAGRRGAAVLGAAGRRARRTGPGRCARPARPDRAAPGADDVRILTEETRWPRRTQEGQGAVRRRRRPGPGDPAGRRGRPGAESEPDGGR